jgi:hypothetical protein
MAQPVPAVSIARLRSIWDDQVAPSARRALLALGFAAFFGMAHLARVGTLTARAGAAAAFGVTLLGIGVRALVVRRRRVDPRAVVRDTIARMDPELGASTLRAITLLDRTAVDERAGSPALAALHLERLLGRASHERLQARAAAAGLRWSTAGLVFAVGAVAVVLVEPFRVIEGLDVLAARDGDAPLRLAWIDEVSMGAAPPEYLHQSGADVRPFRRTAQPRGTTLTVRGRPIHQGRVVVLTDGTADVPFVDDGAGGLVARWTVADSTTLWVAARLGEVRVRQSDEQAVTSIADETPRVVVEGAPRTVRLLDEPSIPVHYEATDDHGLREVDLVLRAGPREERRVLSHPAADVLVDRGGYQVAANDKFFKKTYTPVEITVEARDNDVVSGPKWGKSAPIVVIPPQVGEPEALRYAALIKARDAVTDLVAARVLDKAPTAADAKAHVAREIAAQVIAVKAVQEALAGTYGGLQVRGVVTSLARGQLRRLAKALEAEKASPVAAKHQKLLDESEAALLALDAGVRMIGDKDTRAVAKRLADVADEAAAGLLAATTATDEKSSLGRIDASIQVLDGGGKQMLRLGDLGLDIGEIVANDLRRIARAREAKDLPHAELAARDLAARLRKPEPSFSGGGGHGHGGGRGGGVESGGAPSGAEAGEASAADEEAAETQRELEELAREHAGKIGEVEESLEKAVSPEELEALKQEAKQHAQAIREAVKKLPPSRGQTGSAESSASAGREEAEAMAGALEGGRPRDAVESGRRAVEKLGEAQRLGEQSGGFPPDDKAGKEAGAAKSTLDRELAWAEQALDKLRAASSARAKGDLQRHGKEESKLAERAKELGQKGQGGDRSLPQEMLDRLEEAEQAMRDAEKALAKGDGEKGLRLQQDAQRSLEMARGERDESDREGKNEAPESKQPNGKADIPNKDAHKGPEEFRRRVLKGLGGSSDPLLREAVKRYAEGLLK